MQSKTYVGGNLKSTPLAELWNESSTVGFSRERSVDDLWGFCRECAFADTCMGGCTFTAHAIMGRPGNNPYCHHRARVFAAKGLRERLVPVEAAPGLPFDNGRFEIVTEPLDTPDERGAVERRDLVKIRRAKTSAAL